MMDHSIELVSDTTYQHSNISCSLYYAAKNTLVLSDHSGTINVWKSRNEFHAEIVKSSVKLHAGSILDMIFIPVHGSNNNNNPMVLVTGSSDRKLLIYDLFDIFTNIRNHSNNNSNPRHIQTISQHNGSVLALDYSAGNLISASSDNTVNIYSISTERNSLGLLLPFYTLLHKINIIPSAMTACVRAESGSALYIADYKGNIQLYSHKKQQARINAAPHYFHQTQQKIHALSISKIFFVASENVLISISYDCTVSVVNASLASNKAQFQLSNPTSSRYTAAAWDDVYKELFLADELGWLQIYNIHIDKCVKSVQLKSSPILNIQLYGKNNSKLLITTKNSCQLYNVDRRIRFNEYQPHSDAVIELFFLGSAEGGSVLYSASLDNTIKSFDSYDMNCLSILKSSCSEISCVHALQGSSILVSGHENGLIRLWNIDSGSAINIKHHTNSIAQLLRIQTDRRDCLVSVSYDSYISCWDLSKEGMFNPIPEFSLKCSQDELLCAAYDNNIIYTAGNDCTINGFNIDTRQRVFTAAGHTGSVTNLLCDGILLISASDDCSIRLWNTLDGELLSILTGHKASVRDLILESGLIISCAADSFIMFWDYTKANMILDEKKSINKAENSADPALIDSYYQSDKKFNCLAYSSADKKIFAGTEDGRIAVFEWTKKHSNEEQLLSSQQLINEANQLIEDSLRNNNMIDDVCSSAPLKLPPIVK
jgi:WD40 repeat protein